MLLRHWVCLGMRSLKLKRIPVLWVFIAALLPTPVPFVDGL